VCPKSKPRLETCSIQAPANNQAHYRLLRVVENNNDRLPPINAWRSSLKILEILLVKKR
jgi:hypothetical protein